MYTCCTCWRVATLSRSQGSIRYATKQTQLTAQHWLWGCSIDKKLGLRPCSNGRWCAVDHLGFLRLASLRVCVRNHSSHSCLELPVKYSADDALSYTTELQNGPFVFGYKQPMTCRESRIQTTRLASGTSWYWLRTWYGCKIHLKLCESHNPNQSWSWKDWMWRATIYPTWGLSTWVCGNTSIRSFLNTPATTLQTVSYLWYHTLARFQTDQLISPICDATWRTVLFTCYWFALTSWKSNWGKLQGPNHDISFETMFLHSANDGGMV